MKLIISGADKKYEHELKLKVLDSLPPIISEINFSSNRAFTENKISVVAEDNINVTQVTLDYGADKVVFTKDNQLFTANVVFDKLSRYVMKFCAKDSSDNEKCESINKTFESAEIITGFKKTAKMPSKKVGLYSRYHLFNLTEEVPDGIDVELLEFQAVGQEINDSTFVRIIDGDESIRRFDTYKSVVTIKEPGEIFLEVRSEVVSDYTGSIRFVLPEYAKEINDFEFSVGFKDFDVPEDFTISWHDNNILCKVIDTGDLESSYYECAGLKYSIDTKPEDIDIPTTVEERQGFRNQVEEAEDKVSKVKTKMGIYIALLVVLMLGISAYAYFRIYWWPYIRISAKRQKETYYYGGGNK